MDVSKYLENDKGWYCVTCDGTGGLTIAGVTYLELTCPTCHGHSRGMSAEAFFEELKKDNDLGDGPEDVDA